MVEVFEMNEARPNASDPAKEWRAGSGCTIPPAGRSNVCGLCALAPVSE